MKKISVEKITLNVGAGKNPEALAKGMKLLKSITGIEPIKTFTQKRIPAWGLRPGLPIGCKITLRKQQALQFVTRFLEAKSNKLLASYFDNEGNVSFGIHEYIDIPGVKYDPEIGVMGLQICITLKRPGFRVKRKRIRKASIPRRHRISKEEAISFMQETFKTGIIEEEQ